MVNNRFCCIAHAYSLLLAIFIIFSGCSITKDIEASHNRELLGDLSIGMTKDQVVQHMGKPWKTEAFMKNQKPYTVLYYVTQRIPDGTTTDEEMTPVVFKEDILVGWGRRYFSDFRIELKESGTD